MVATAVLLEVQDTVVIGTMLLELPSE